MPSVAPQPLLLLTRKHLQDLPKRFPVAAPGASLCWLFAYGSAIFPQLSASSGRSKNPSLVSERMIDLVAVVEGSLRSWHAENLRMNPGDYSLPFRINVIPESWRLSIIEWMHSIGAQVFFNTRIPWKGGAAGSGDCGQYFIKYAVVSRDALFKDCQEWRSLFLAGRLHKPTLTLYSASPTAKLGEAGMGEEGVNEFPIETNDEHSLLEILEENQMHAVEAAVDLLHIQHAAKRSPILGGSGPSLIKFTLGEFFLALLSLSYVGDVRMAVGAEAPGKIDSILRGQERLLREMYMPHMRFYVDFRSHYGKLYRSSENGDDSLSTVYSSYVPDVQDCRERLEELEGRVRRTTLIEAVKAVATVGPVTSLRYALAKWSKRILAYFC